MMSLNRNITLWCLPTSNSCLSIREKKIGRVTQVLESLVGFQWMALLGLDRVVLVIGADYGGDSGIIQRYMYFEEGFSTFTETSGAGSGY